MAVEEIIYGQEEEEGQVEEGGQVQQQNVQQQHGPKRITTADECQQVSNGTMCLAFLDCVKELAAVSVSKCTTAGCALTPHIKEGFTGSALYLTWVRTFNFLQVCDTHAEQVYCM